MTTVIPFLYGITFIAITTRAFLFKFKKKAYSERAKFEPVIAALPMIIFFGDFQVLEHSITNAGFVIMTIVYIRSSIHQSRKEYHMLLASGAES